jgi:hypothetical protein
LQQSLMARLDRLGSARDVAHIDSVIGRGFSYGLLRAVAGMDDVLLQAALEKLADADIVLVQGLPPASDYRFKHTLIQDVAYENLLKSRRQVLHRRVAETLCDQFADMAAAEPEVLAHHFSQAGLTDAAIEWLGKAGDQAVRRSAFQEAISHFGKAIEMAEKSGDSTAGRRLKLQTGYGQAMLWSKGYTAPETEAAFKRAQELAGNIDVPGDRLVAIYGQWAGQFMRGQLQGARAMITASLLRGQLASIAASTLLPPVDDAEHQLQVLSDARSPAALPLLGYASAAQSAAGVSRLVPHALLRLLQPEDRLALGEGDPHPLPDRVRRFARERENVAQEGFDALVHRVSPLSR